jgi:hypothetical protein
MEVDAAAESSFWSMCCLGRASLTCDGGVGVRITTAGDFGRTVGRKSCRTTTSGERSTDRDILSETRSDRRRDESFCMFTVGFELLLSKGESSARRLGGREASLGGWHPTSRREASMNFKTGSFSPRSDEQTEGTQSTASDTSRKSRRAGSGTDAARDEQSPLASPETDLTGSLIVREDSGERSRGVKCREREMGVAIEGLGSVGIDRSFEGGVRVMAFASSPATSADVRVIACASSTAATSAGVCVGDGKSESSTKICVCAFACAHAAAAAEGEGGELRAAAALDSGEAPLPEMESVELHRDVLVSAISPGK